MRRSLVLTDRNAERDPELVKAIAASGWQVADVMRLNEEEIRDPKALGLMVSERARHAGAQDIVISISETRMTMLQRVLQALHLIPGQIRLARTSQHKPARKPGQKPSLAEKSAYEGPEANDNTQYSFSTLRPGLPHPDRPRTQMPRPWQDAAKRAFDIAFAGSALILLMPFLLFVALLVRLDSKGPVLFSQTRTGLHGRKFQILKFRSMSVTENGQVIRQATRNDTRVTRIGRILRATSIDELPQLINVIAGDMSIVGPRPHALAHDRLYGAQITDYVIRQHVRPGLTGWAQVNGSRGPTPRLEDMQRRVELDLWYVRHWSLLLDLRIILRTVAVLLRKGAAF